MLKLKSKDAFNNKSIKVPFFSPYITDDDRKIIQNTLKNNLLTDGPILENFESSFCKFTNSKYAIGVSNATSALHLSLKSLGITTGDEVIIPDMTFIATSSAIMLTGATPVLADVNDDDFNISINSIKKNINSKTKAILPVHFAGQPCDIKKIAKIAKSNDLLLVEDCAHALGTKFENKHVGTFGNTGCFSFYPTKNITSIEGGMVITNSKKTAKFILSSRNHGLTKSLKNRFSKGKPWDYDVIEPGYNYRLDEIRSALGLNQLKRIKKINLKRKIACDYYNSKLKNIFGIGIPTYSISTATSSSYHLYIIKITNDFKISRDELFKKLLDAGIQTSVHYKPLHEFTILKTKGKINDKLKTTKILYNQIISLPLYQNITRKEQDIVIDCIKN